MIDLDSMIDLFWIYYSFGNQLSFFSFAGGLILIKVVGMVLVSFARRSYAKVPSKR